MFDVIRLGRLSKECPGRNHSWYQSRIGLVRKPNNADLKANPVFNNTWWEKIILFIRDIFKK